jgi:RNA polymerase sigma-70 factor (ECF subfamily)
MISESDLKTWVLDYSDPLYSYIFKRVGDDELAKDLVQETFIAAYKNRDKFRENSNPLAWLYTIIKHKMIDHFRAKKRKPTDSLDDQPHIDAILFNSKGHWTQAPSSAFFSSDMDEAERKEFWSFLQLCQNDLSEQQKMAFVFKYMEGWSSKRICKELDISSSNYWVLIHRAKLKLRQCLENNWLNK